MWKIGNHKSNFLLEDWWNYKITCYLYTLIKKLQKKLSKNLYDTCCGNNKRVKHKKNQTPQL